MTSNSSSSVVFGRATLRNTGTTASSPIAARRWSSALRITVVLPTPRKPVRRKAPPLECRIRSTSASTTSSLPSSGSPSSSWAANGWWT
jgi:hypothetical protein